MDDAQAHEHAGRVEALLDELDGMSDPVAQRRALEAVQALVEFYGEGLARVVARAGPELARELADDELVGHLMILHELHPEPLEARVRGALEQVRPYLESHGGDVELREVVAGKVRLRLQGSCSGCPSSTATLEHAIEEEIRKAAPEIEEIEAEGVTDEVKPELLQIEIAETLRCPAGEPAS